MKIKISITLSDEVIKAIDLHIGEYRSRSEFLEMAARKFIVQLARKEAEQRDLEIINRRADSLNAEAEDVLTYQVPLRSTFVGSALLWGQTLICDYRYSVNQRSR